MTLEAYLTKAQLTRAEFAQQIDVASETVRRYLAGTRIPDRAVMERIAVATGYEVTANDFYRIAA